MKKRGYSRAFKAHGDTGHNYLIHDIPKGLWNAASKQARRDGLSMRATLLHLLSAYVDGGVAITTTTTSSTDAARDEATS